jgi:hypothetical protein
MKWNKGAKQSFYYSKKVKITHILNLIKLEKKLHWISISFLTNSHRVFTYKKKLSNAIIIL